jgi:von Willebrand factor type A domain/F5/8 type C domain
VVTLDTSGSMKQRLAEAQAAAKSFLEALPPEDKVQVFGFAREVKPLSPLGADRASAKAAIGATSARGDTALYDALYASVDALKGTPGRKAIVLLSDGADDDGTGRPLSKHSLEDVLALAREVNVPIFTIGIGEIDEAVLKKTADQTGAMFLLAPQPTDLRKLYDKVGEQLAGQYHIFYTSNLPGDGSEHRVRLDYGSASAFKEYQSPLVAGAPTPQAAAAPGGELTNIAAAKEGGRIVDFTSEFNQTDWAVKNLIGGDPKRGWEGTSNGPHAVVIDFRDEQIAEIEDIVVNPYTSGNAENWATEVEFHTSLTYPWKGYTSIGQMTLKPEGTDQVFSLPTPVRARYVKVVFKSNGGGVYMEAGKVQVMGRLVGQGEGVPVRTNWASKANGAAIEKATSQFSDTDWAAENLIDDAAGVGKGWEGKSNASQEVVIKLSDQKEITDFAINTYASGATENWASQVEILTSSEHAYKGFQSHGKMDIPLDGDWHVLSLLAPVSAKYVKVVFLKNGGGPYMEAGEVRAYGR